MGAAIALGAYALLVRLGEARAPREIAVEPAVTQTLIGLALGLAMFGAEMAGLVAFGLYDVTFIGPTPAWRAAGLACARNQGVRSRTRLGQRLNGCFWVALA